MLAVGEHLFGDLDERSLRMTTGLAGGIGCTEHELCGAMSAGILAIGALHGRTRPDVDDRHCQALAARYRQRFVDTFGTTNCHELRQQRSACRSLVEETTGILLEIIDTSQ